METEDLEEMLATVQRVQYEIGRLALHPLADIEERLTRELMQRQAKRVDGENQMALVEAGPI